MDYFAELMRIAEETENDNDQKILIQAAVKLIDKPEPKIDEWKTIPGFGYHNIKQY